jgi:predicted RNA-binding protein with TRAM domain
MKDMQPPVKVDETYDVVVENIGEKGDGIVKVKGFVIFVPDVKEREHVKIKITKVFKKVGFGEVVERYKEEIAEPPQIEEPKASDSFGEDLDKEDDLDEFEKLAKE